MLGYCSFGQHPVAVADKEEQQVVLRLGERHRPTVGLDALFEQINFYAIVLERIAGSKLLAAYDGVDTHTEFGQMERLGQIVVSPNLQPLDLVVERVLCRHDDDAGRVVTTLDVAQYVESAAAGQHQVQQHTVVVVAAHLFQSFVVVEGLLAQVFLRFQISHNAVRQLVLVFYYQYFHLLYCLSLFVKHHYAARRYEQGAHDDPRADGLLEKYQRQADGDDHTQLVYRRHPRHIARLQRLEVEEPRQPRGCSR